LEEIPLKLDRAATRAAVKTLFERSGYAQARLRFAVGFDRPDEITISMEPFGAEAKYLNELRTNGVVVATHTIVRSNPRAKTNAWVRQRQQTRASLGIEAYEVIICNQDGQLLEGFSSNFYAIQSGRLYTSLDGVLPGIMRQVVFEIAPEVLPVVMEPVCCDEVADLQEAFLTSSTRGIVPIIRIDDTVIGDGKPGPDTRRLLEVFDQWVAAHLEPIA
jgi:branched-chain amino acid aminotransferase